MDIFNNELSLEELINFDWYSMDYSQISESDYIFLKNRGKYLTEYVDRIEGLASYDEVESLPENGNYVIPWGPSKGKTSAIRRFIVENRLKYGVFATKKISDIDMLYVDIISQAKYLGYKTVSIMKYHSESNGSEFHVVRDRLESSFWILCTHERLFIEPQEMIYVNRRNLAEVKFKDYLIVDEYPSTLYRKISTEDSFSLLAMEAMSDLEYDPQNSYGVVRDLVDGCYSDPIETPRPMIGVLNNVPTPTNQSYSLDKRRGFDSTESIISKNRLAFFAYYFYIKAREEMKKKAKDQNPYLYYSVLDLPPTTKYVFDGTGDILFGDSKKFEIVDHKYPRELTVDKLSRIESKITRKSKLEDIITEYSTIIDNILKDNPDSDILVYTWKSARDDYVYRGDEADICNSNDIPEILYGRLSEQDKSRVNIIHYQSGRERVTSKYKDSDVLVILGGFYVPTSVIADLKLVLESDKLTTSDYTKSLIVQCIYRTQARVGNPIKLYYSGYSSDFIYKCLLDCNLESEVEEITELLGNSEIDKRLSIEMMDIELYNRLIEVSDNGKISTTKISEFFQYKRFDSRSVNNKLGKGNIPFEYYPSKQVDKNVWSDGYYLISLEFYSN